MSINQNWPYASIVKNQEIIFAQVLSNLMMDKGIKYACKVPKQDFFDENLGKKMDRD